EGPGVPDLRAPPHGARPDHGGRDVLLLQSGLRREVQGSLLTAPPARMPSPDPYVAIDAQPDPSLFARLLELRGAQPHQRRLRRAFLAFAGVPAGARVLDVGCGTGVVTRELAHRAGARGRVVGVDPSRAFVSEARARSRAAGLEAVCRFRAGRGDALQFRDRAFDVVVAVTVLLHVTDSDRVLAEMCRVVRPGGRVAVLDQDFGTLVLDLPDRA